MNENDIIVFLEQTSPQTTGNTLRFWSFGKPIIYKNTTKLRADTFGFYALNGESTIDFKEHPKKEDICEFLSKVRERNPDMSKRIILVLDNFKPHKSGVTIEQRY